MDYTNILVSFISSDEGYVLEILKYMFNWLDNLYISSLAFQVGFNYICLSVDVPKCGHGMCIQAYKVVEKSV